MRSYEILKTFKYSPDGIKIVDLKKGETDGINDNDIESMIKAGFIKEADSKKMSTLLVDPGPELRHRQAGSQALTVQVHGTLTRSYD